jgi:transposase InsO family protein
MRCDEPRHAQQPAVVVNYKRVERLYQEAGLQVRRRKCKKVPVGERQPLLRPSAANEVWSMDFVFDRTAEGRVVKCLTIVDDAKTRDELARLRGAAFDWSGAMRRSNPANRLAAPHAVVGGNAANRT